MYIYTFACHEDELSLCGLEQRALFGSDSLSRSVILSGVTLDPSRSPFIRERIELTAEAGSLQELAKQIRDRGIHARSTFKVISVKLAKPEPVDKLEYSEQRAVEREIGLHIKGKADVHNPEQVFGVLLYNGRWYFGSYVRNSAIWLSHSKKPRNFTMALPTRIARAVANIAVPHPEGIEAIDPCCGIGTVLVEARSMGISIAGRDRNPLAVRGARENLAYFDLPSEVVLGDIADVGEGYDTVILDMPYNLVSKISPEEQLSLLRHAHRIAARAVVVSIDNIDEMAEAAGFTIADRATAHKGSFFRHIIVLGR